MAGGKRKGEGNASLQLYNKSAKGLGPCQAQLEQRAAWCLDYVRALNTQFAAWVEQQKKDHLDELWEAGVEDYLKHARTLLTDYKDVVDWLKNSSSNNNNNNNSSLQGHQQQVLSPPCARRTPLFDTPLVDGQSGPPQQDSTAARAGGGAALGSFNSSSMWTTSPTSPGARAGAIAERTPLPPMARSGSVAAFRSPLPSAGTLPAASEAEKKDADAPGSVAAFRSPLPAAAVLTHNETKDAQGPESSVAAAPTATPGGFTVSAVRSPMPIPIFARPPDITTTERKEVDEDQDAEAPGSPSFVSTQEKGIQIVHQVRGKLYFQVTNGENRAWKDLGRGQIILRCREGAPSTSKESKPTIVFRNEVGKVLLNALLYTGLKLKTTKADITLCLLIAEPTQQARSQTCTFRLQSLEDAKALAEAIEAHTPL